MNIKGKYYCSRCLAPLPDETVCLYCGHDPEERYDSHLMEEGTLLSDQRYRVGVVITEDNWYCCYGGWDYWKGKPVLIKELFPKKLISRDILVSDNVVIPSGREKEYAEVLKQYINMGYRGVCTPAIIDAFYCNGFGYHIFDYGNMLDRI